MYEYSCIVKRVIDGDSVVIDIDLGFNIWLYDQHVRLAGIDAPEIRTLDLEEKARGLDSKQMVEWFLKPGTEQIFKSYEYGTDKYGRLLGSFTVFDPQQNRWTDLCQSLLESGYAKPYGE